MKRLIERADHVVDRPPLDEQPIAVIRASKKWGLPNLLELWEHRELLYFLVWRDVKVRYKQTALGAGWSVFQPLLTTIVFTIFFGRLAGIPSDGAPYAVFAFSALLPWQLFAEALRRSGISLVSNQALITKVYFPRLLIPMSAILSCLPDFGISLLALLGMMIYFGVTPTFAVLAVPLLLILTLAAALGVGLWLSALNVRYRDVTYTTPFLIQIWLLVTPIAYPTTLIPLGWRNWYGLNPMVGVVEGFRWALLGSDGSAGTLIVISVLVVLAILFGGLIYFGQMEKTFADVI